MSDPKRVVIPSKMLLPVLKVWLRGAPDWVWGKEPKFERLKKSRGFYDPFAEPDAKHIAAELIVAAMDRLGWKMCHPVTSSSQSLLQPHCEGCSVEQCDQERQHDEG
jgi:hypothetical protein